MVSSRILNVGRRTQSNDIFPMITVGVILLVSIIAITAISINFRQPFSLASDENLAGKPTQTIAGCTSCTADQVCINSQCVALPSCAATPGQFCQSDDDGTSGLLERTMPGSGICPTGQYCMRCRGRNVLQNGQCVPGPSCTPCSTKRLGNSGAVGGEPSGVPNGCVGSNVVLCQQDNCASTITCTNGCQTFGDGTAACRQ